MEESLEARKAVMEIIDQKKGQIIAIDKTLADDEECAQWMSYVGDKVKRGTSKEKLESGNSGKKGGVAASTHQQNRKQKTQSKPKNTGKTGHRF